MTTHKVEEMLKRLGILVDVEGKMFLGEVLPTKLAQVLVEMEERIEGRRDEEIIDFDQVEVKAGKLFAEGYLAALEDVKDMYLQGGDDSVLGILDDLKKKYE